MVFPRTCHGCKEVLARGEENICTACLREMPRATLHLEPENLFYLKLRARLPIQEVAAFLSFRKSTAVQHILHALKYKNKPELGAQLGKAFGCELQRWRYQENYDLIIPVPLHKERQRRRGYNQSEWFAKGLAESLNLEVSSEAVTRIRATMSQTRKSVFGRWQNVKDVFHVVQPEKIRGKRILLVDDVITSGATMEACGQKLLDAGCTSLSFVTIAAATE